MKTAWRKVWLTLVYGETRGTRLWLALVEITLGLYLINAAKITPYFGSMLASLPADDPIVWWALIFWFHSITLIVGLSGRYSAWTLMLEGVLGWCAWGIVAITNFADQGFPGPFMACWAMMTWILIRYPTHWVHWGRRDD